MKLSQFKFKLPEDQIALYPHGFIREFENEKGEKEQFRIVRRDEARLMVLHRKSGKIDMYQKDENGKEIEGKFIEFRNIIDYFDEGDVFILNDTKVRKYSLLASMVQRRRQMPRLRYSCFVN